MREILMGTYLNPGNSGFWTIRNDTYVDKTGLISYINDTINTPRKLTCFSRPRRFGKSFAAKMLCAYYDKCCDSGALFEGLEISKADSYSKYLNQFDVIYLDITRFISLATNIKTVVRDIQDHVIEELRAKYPTCIKKDEQNLADTLLKVCQQTNEPFIMIIDEWDALFREAKENHPLQVEYIQFLRGLFKAGPATDKTIAAAYMTGILPIKKYGTQSALTDFREFTMTNPAKLAQYVGFTEPEVQNLCSEFQMDFESMKIWYDGYSFSRVSHVYSPNSVMNAVQNEEFRAYWSSSETYESLKNYITEDFDGLKDAIVQMLGGQHIHVDTMTFQNDMTSFKSRDDVITLLIHLGYLAYDSTKDEVFIPNREVASAFRSAIKGSSWTEVNKALSQSEKLLKATLCGDTETVAELLELAHEACASSLEYNDENSLSCAILLAYYTAQNDYEIFRELPTGKGFADYAFIPRKNSHKPALLVELKYNHSADSAIRQIHDNRYSGKLSGLTNEIILVGINYDKYVKGENKKHHTCIIEKIKTPL
ncbi:MAG: ATP-binding protein [Lachnospiraceae bacterium]|nr:ATP-binding protein [Lachnospiraceae bacterium]